MGIFSYESVYWSLCSVVRIAARAARHTVRISGGARNCQRRPRYIRAVIALSSFCSLTGGALIGTSDRRYGYSPHMYAEQEVGEDVEYCRSFYI